MLTDGYRARVQVGSPVNRKVLIADRPLTRDFISEATEQMEIAESSLLPDSYQEIVKHGSPRTSVRFSSSDFNLDEGAITFENPMDSSDLVEEEDSATSDDKEQRGEKTDWADADFMNVLVSIPVVAELDSAIRQELVALMTMKSWRAGETIVSKDKTATHFFLIKSGVVEFEVDGFQSGATGTTSRFRTRAVGEYFGDIALINDSPVDATAIAHTVSRFACCGGVYMSCVYLLTCVSPAYARSCLQDVTCAMLSRQKFLQHATLIRAVRDDDQTAMRRKKRHGADEEDQEIFKANRSKIANTGIIQALLRLCNVDEVRT
jgi:hypothetical protein|eukprot:COSAG01_NODE_5608_length_4149_cov_2.951358_3_plen_320_part_00